MVIGRTGTARNLHTGMAPDEYTWVNDRAHDLVDLQLAARVYRGSMTELFEVAVRLFAARQAHTWPPRVTVRQGWHARYTAEANGLDVLASIDAAIVWANEWVSQIDRATHNDDVGQGRGRRGDV